MLYGKRIRLRAIEREDLQSFVAWINDPEVRCNLLLYYPISIPEEEKWYEQMLTSPQDEHPLAIEVKTEKGWELAGNVGFININVHDRSAEIGIFIGRKGYWDHGYGREALRLMVQHGFENININRVYLYVYETNQRGIKCYEEAGFMHEGRLREARFHEGKYIDVFVMGILRSEWRDKKNGGEG